MQSAEWLGPNCNRLSQYFFFLRNKSTYFNQYNEVLLKVSLTKTLVPFLEYQSELRSVTPHELYLYTFNMLDNHNSVAKIGGGGGILECNPVYSKRLTARLVDLQLALDNPVAIRDTLLKP